jgi:hypothetical protein
MYIDYNQKESALVLPMVPVDLIGNSSSISAMGGSCIPCIARILILREAHNDQYTSCSGNDRVHLLLNILLVRFVGPSSKCHSL